MPEKIDFVALRCSSCGALDIGPTPICRSCGAEQMDETRVSGGGRLASWTVIRRAPTRFKGQEPYAVVVVDLDCGLRVTGRGIGEIESLFAGAAMCCVGQNEETVFFDLAKEQQP
jgi:uncharacterized OB-fold protein